MSKNFKNKGLLPAGFSDKLSSKVQKQNLIIDKILNYFSKYSYLRVSPPLIEFEETLLSEGPGVTLKENTFRIMDPITNRMMALRSDMTTQISRISSSRMKHYTRPLRLSYSGEVLRVKPTTLNMHRQITQVGAEIIGKVNDELESEIILIALNVLSALKIKNLSIDLNYPNLKRFFLNGFSKKMLQQVEEAIERKDLNFLENNTFPKKNEIINLIQNSGYFENSKLFLQKLTKKNQKNKSIIYLANIAEKIKTNIKNVDIIIDPLETNSSNYHDGLTFTIFSKDVKAGIAKGGTYKTNAGEKATGISIYTELIDNIPASMPKQKRVLLKSLDFVNANLLIEQGYDVVFSKEVNNNNFVTIAKKVNCGYVFIKDNLTKIK